MPVWFVAWAGPALAEDLDTLAARDGHAAMMARVDAVLAEEKAKKVARVLEALGLGRVSMPVRPFRGAELALGGVSPVGACRWDGELACRFDVRGPVSEGEYEVTCRSSLGAMLAVPSRLVEVRADGGTYEVRPMEACFRLGQELLLHPAAAGDLEGVGQGTELIPPELAGLTRRQVEDTIASWTPSFRHCLVKHDAAGLTGKLVVAYRIAADTTVTAEVDSSTLGHPAVEACVLERFREIRFPPPMDGWDHGTWPLTFQ